MICHPPHHARCSQVRERLRSLYVASRVSARARACTHTYAKTPMHAVPSARGYGYDARGECRMLFALTPILTWNTSWMPEYFGTA